MKKEDRRTFFVVVSTKGDFDSLDMKSNVFDSSGSSLSIIDECKISTTKSTVDDRQNLHPPYEKNCDQKGI